MSENHDPIIEIESRLAFQDDTIHQLNTVVVSQEQRIDKLERSLKLLAQRLMSLEQSAGQGGSEDTAPPPHY